MPQEGKAYIHAALALHFAGRQITEESLKQVINAIGLNIDEMRVKMLVTSLSEINIEEILKQAAVPVAAPLAAPAAAPTAAPVEEKKEEEEREEKKEEELDVATGLESLFGF